MYCGAKTDAYLENIIKHKHLSNIEIDNFKKNVLKFYTTLCSQIKNRFNFQVKFLKVASKAPINAKGGRDVSVARFINLFPQTDCVIEHVNTAWKILMEQNVNDLSSDSSKFWNQIENIKNSLNEHHFNNLFQIIEVIMILSHSSASVERGFSQLTPNRTKIRNRLSIKTVGIILITKNVCSW